MFHSENTSIYTSLDKIESFVEKANNFHSTIKFPAEMSERNHVPRPVSIKYGLRTANCGLRTADCGLRTADCGLDVKRGLSIKCRLQTEYKHGGIKRELRTIYIKTALER